MSCRVKTSHNPSGPDERSVKPGAGGGESENQRQTEMDGGGVKRRGGADKQTVQTAWKSLWSPGCPTASRSRFPSHPEVDQDGAVRT